MDEDKNNKFKYRAGSGLIWKKCSKNNNFNYDYRNHVFSEANFPKNKVYI